jgi:hypothetical protein
VLRRRPRFAVTLALALVSLAGCSAPELSTIGWNSVEPSRDLLVLTIGYAADRCQTFDHAEVSYLKERLLVTLFVRRNNMPCLDLRFPQIVAVPLHEELGGRPVEDGSLENRN